MARDLSDAVDVRAAALYAKVQPDTLRQWRRRGLIAPCGGTQRRPLYRLEDLERVRSRSAS